MKEALRRSMRCAIVFTVLAVLTTSVAGAGEIREARSPVQDQYVVVLKADTSDFGGPSTSLVAQDLALRYGAEQLLYVYEHAVRGFAVRMPAARAALLADDPQVEYVEQDAVVHAVDTQSNATWGLDRIDQRDLPLSGDYTFANDGSNVHAYIIDTGIRTTHDDFGGRAQHGFDAVDDDNDATDCNGHGTHVAGTVGGAEWGVAKGVTLVAVRVLDCEGSGTISGVVAGVDWVTANAQLPAVANMSLGGGSSSTLDDAVRNSIASGVTYAVAAGNGDFIGRPQDACDGSPSGVTEAITVGATDENDDEASFSNFGTCVDILAPGVSVTSAWHDSDTATNTISGTSMASPHVAGGAALYLHANTTASPSDVASALTSNASVDKINLHSSSESGGTPNLLLYTAFIGDDDGDDGGDDGGDNSAPTASFTFDCTDLTCDFDGSGSSDPDGDALSYSWAFGDGNNGTGETTSHTYGADGTYTVTLTVSDGSLSDSQSQDVTVSSSTDDSITLSASGRKVRGRHHIDLTWDGATSTNVDVYRNGSLITTTANDGAFTDATDNRGGATYEHQVCEAGTNTCSNVTTTTF